MEPDISARFWRFMYGERKKMIDVLKVFKLFPYPDMLSIDSQKSNQFLE